MLRFLFKRALVLIGVFALVWIGVILWWHGTNQMPTPSDIVAYLLALPTGLVIGYALLRRAIDGIRTSLASTPPAANAAATPGSEASNEPPALTRAQLLRASIAGAFARAAPGDDPTTIIAALADGARASLDTQLQDDRGFPLQTARVSALDDERVQALRDIWRARFAGVDPGEDMLRAVALLNDTLLDATDLIASHAAVAAAERIARHAEGRLPASETASPSQQQHLQIVAIMPSHWTDAARAALAQYLQQEIIARWPAGHVDVTAIAGTSPGVAFIQLDQAIVALDHPPTAPSAHITGDTHWRIVAATHSDLSDAAIAREDSAGRLFTSARQHGAIAGEAAAALVLRAAPAANESIEGSTESAAESTAPSPALAALAPLALLSRPALGERGNAPGPAAKPNPDTLDEAALRALASAQTKAADIGAVFADRAASSAHAVELALFANARFPQLEPLAETIALDAGCGVTQAAGALLGVALAAQHAADSARPAVATTLADARERAALVVLPHATHTIQT
jgi:hypothetical protein